MSSNIDFKSLYRCLMHEVRSLSSEALEHMAQASRSFDGKGDYARAKNEVLAAAELLYQLTNWLDLSELQSGSMALDPQLMTDTSLHGVFFRASKMMRPRLVAKKMKFKFSADKKSQDTFMISAYPILQALPYLLLDNSIKYSAMGTEVSCRINRVASKIIVEFNSEGPAVEEDEEAQLFEDGFRGVNAIEACAQGEGRGLGLARGICRLHKADIEAICVRRCYSVGGVDYGEFKLKLTFDV